MSPTKAAPKSAKPRTPVPAVDTDVDVTTAVKAIASPVREIAMIELDRIFPHPLNPRRDVGDLTELADSITAHGVQQPVTLLPHPDEPGAYMSLLGHRRIAASAAAGLLTVPAIVVENLSERDQLALMLVENVQRTDLTISEEGAGFQGLLDLGETVNGVSALTGRHAHTITKRVRIATLPEGVTRHVDAKQLTIEDALTLLDLEETDAEIFAQTVKSLSAEKMTVDPGKLVTDADQRAKRKAHLQSLTDAFAANGHRLYVNSMNRGGERIANLGLTPEEHAHCPGALAHFWSEWSMDNAASLADAEYVCSMPEQYHPGMAEAHRNALAEANAARQAEYAARQLTPFEALKKRFGDDLRTAEVNRAEWIVARLIGPTQEAVTFADAIDDMLVRTCSAGGDVNLSTYSQWAEVAFPSNRITISALAAAHFDSLVPSNAGAWDFYTEDAPSVYAWFELLSSHGYELSPVERVWNAIAQPFAAAKDGDTAPAKPQYRDVLLTFTEAAELEIPEELKPAESEDEAADADFDDEDADFDDEADD